MARPAVANPIPSLSDEAHSSGSEMQGLTEIELGLIDIFVGLADIMGVPKSVAEIYGLLFASPKPLAFQEVTERLRMSKGSASQGLRLLRTVGAIRPVYVAGDRRDHFVPETELRTLLTGFLRERVRPHLDGGALRIEALQMLMIASPLVEVTSEEARILRTRIEKLRSWHRKSRSLIPLVTKLFG